MVHRGDRPVAHVVFPRWVGWGMQGVFARGFPSLALLVVAALVEREGWEVVLVDENHDAIPTQSPDVALIVCWTGLAPQAYAAAATYRSRGVPVVLGGIHPSMLPGEALRHCDAIVAGEAEAVMPELLTDVLCSRLRPIYHGRWGDMSATPDVRDYGHLYQRFPNSRYRPTHTHQSTRGCRFNCDFCSVIRINGRGSRHLDPARTVEELRYRTRMPPRMPGKIFVFFTDDDLAADLDYLAALLEALVAADLPVRWGGQASIGMARHPELLALAQQSGCATIFTGFESVSRDSLIEANKKNRPNEYAGLIGAMHDHGIAVEGGFIFGFDHDRPDVFDHTVEYVQDAGVDTAHFTILTPFPGTATFARMYGDGRVFDTNWSHYTSYRTVFEPAHMSADELDAGLAHAYRRFYSRPLRWARARRSFGVLPNLSWASEAAINYSWSRVYNAKRRTPSELHFTADPADLDDLLRTSAAPASDAITTAISMVDPTRRLPGSDLVTPVTLGSRL